MTQIASEEKNKKKKEFSNQMRGNSFLSNEIMVWKKLWERRKSWEWGKREGRNENNYEYSIGLKMGVDEGNIECWLWYLRLDGWI